MALPPLTWSSYVLQLKILAPIKLKPNETRCIRLNLGITAPPSTAAFVCRDTSSYISIFFTYIDSDDMSNIPVYIQNSTDFEIDMNTVPAILNIFAVSIPSIIVEPLPVFKIQQFDRTRLPHDLCQSQIMLFGDITRVRSFVRGLKWVTRPSDEHSRSIKDAMIWIDLGNIDVNDIKDSVTVEYISNTEIFVQQVLLYEKLLIVKLVQDVAYDSRQNPPLDVYLQLGICAKSPHVRMHHHEPQLISCDNGQLTIKASTDIISSTIHNTYMIYKNTFQSQGKCVGLFIPIPIHGISINSYIWYENKTLNLTVRGLKKNIHVHRGQRIGRVFFLPSQQLTSPPNPIAYSWEEVSTLLVGDTAVNDSDNKPFDGGLQVVPEGPSQVVSEEPARVPSRLFQRGMSNINQGTSRSVTPVPELHTSNYASTQTTATQTNSRIGIDNVTSVMVDAGTQHDPVFFGSTEQKPHVVANAQTNTNAQFSTRQFIQNPTRGQHKVPVLYRPETAAYYSDVLLTITYLGMRLDKSHMIPLKFVAYTDVDERFTPSITPEPVTILSGNIVSSINTPRSLKRGFPPINTLFSKRNTDTHK